MAKYKIGDRVVSINPGHHPGLPGVITGMRESFRGPDFGGAEGIIYSVDVQTSLIISKCAFCAEDMQLLDETLRELL